MFIQIEITTHCNYGCFYCAGRDMVQKHMEMDCFENILSRLPSGKHQVSLQGEGEPMTHPLFWNMVELVCSYNKIPYTITNASLMDASQVPQWFPEIGISLDTIDPEEAQRLGRYKLQRVLDNLTLLINAIGPKRIIVHTVNYGQALLPLRQYLQQRGLVRHIIQPLQRKPDYQRHYSGRFPILQTPCYHYRCRYIEQPLMRFYTIDGIEMPCCFIKDTTSFTSENDIKRQLQEKKVPASCMACREIMIPTDQSLNCVL